MWLPSHYRLNLAPEALWTMSTARSPLNVHATMDPRSSLVTRLQHCLPFLAEKDSEASIRWKVCFGRLSRCTNEAFPRSECAAKWRVIEEADEETFDAGH